jgi:hypothetical protein
MTNTFNEFKRNFENRFNLQSILDLGEDSVRYDFFIAFMNNNNLQPYDIQVEYPINPNAFVSNLHPNSKRKENPQIDLFCNHPNKVITAEFGLFKRNSNPNGQVNAPEKVFKMLNDMLRLSLNQIFNHNEAFFVCVADSKILGKQMRNNILPAFPAATYVFNHVDINTWIRNLKSAESIFDKRFVDKANILQLSINAELIFNQRIQNPAQPLAAANLNTFPATNNLETRTLVYKITGKNKISAHNSVQAP